MTEEFFTIGEVSKSTKIPISTLRYYDKVGLLSPTLKNTDTNYRYYNPMQIIILKAISHMRKIGFSIEYIKSHFKNMSYEHTLELFEKIIVENRKEIEKLQEIEIELLDGCKKLKENIELEKQIGVPFLKEFPEIKGVRFTGPINTRKELHKTIKLIDNFETSNNLHPTLRGFRVSFKCFEKNKEVKDELIAVMEEDNYNNSLISSAGKYACVYGKGEFEKQELIESLIEWIKNNNFKADDNFFVTFSDYTLMFKGKKDFLYLIKVLVN
ncbi:MAG: MerR family transcriptional regulator [Cetobacterium sp.]